MPDELPRSSGGVGGGEPSGGLEAEDAFWRNVYEGVEKLGSGIEHIAHELDPFGQPHRHPGAHHHPAPSAGGPVPFPGLAAGGGAAAQQVWLAHFPLLDPFTVGVALVAFGVVAVVAWNQAERDRARLDPEYALVRLEQEAAAHAAFQQWKYVSGAGWK